MYISKEARWESSAIP